MICRSAQRCEDNELAVAESPTSSVGGLHFGNVVRDGTLLRHSMHSPRPYGSSIWSEVITSKDADATRADVLWMAARHRPPMRIEAFSPKGAAVRDFEGGGAPPQGWWLEIQRSCHVIRYSGTSAWRFTFGYVSMSEQVIRPQQRQQAAVFHDGDKHQDGCEAKASDVMAHRDGWWGGR